MKYFLYTQPCVSDRSRKTNRPSWPVAPRPRDIRVYGMTSAARLRTGMAPIPDILHGSYLGFPSNLPLPRIIRPCFSHTRLDSITAGRAAVKHIFSISVKIFLLIFVQASEFSKRAKKPPAAGRERPPAGRMCTAQGRMRALSRRPTRTLPAPLPAAHRGSAQRVRSPSPPHIDLYPPACYNSYPTLLYNHYYIIITDPAKRRRSVPPQNTRLRAGERTAEWKRIIASPGCSFRFC